MGEYSTKQPLLSSKEDGFNGTYANPWTPYFVSSTKWVLKFAMWAIFIAWATFLSLSPLDSVDHLFKNSVNATSGTLFGITGSILLIYGGPIIIIAFLGITYLIITKDDVQEVKKQKYARFRLWTFPVIVDGPFGVVSAAELIGIVLFSLYTVWAVSVYTVQNYNLLSVFELTMDKRFGDYRSFWETSWIT